MVWNGTLSYKGQQREHHTIASEMLSSNENYVSHKIPFYCVVDLACL
jgi:hypothetical protein